MPSQAAATLRRHAWLLLVGVTVLDVGLSGLWPFFYQRGGDSPEALRLLLPWVPFALRLLPRVALLVYAWPSLREGGSMQVLLGLQAALPALAVAVSRFLLPAILGTTRSLVPQIYFLMSLVWAAAELVAVGVAFRLRKEEPGEGELGVATAASLAILGQGWITVGLLPLLVRRTKDPLLEEWTGAAESPESAARRASITGFLLVALLPLLVWAGYRPGGPLGFHLWLLIPSLLLGSFLWCRLGASLGAAGKVWRGFTWALLGLWPLLILAGVLLLVLLAGGRWH